MKILKVNGEVMTVYDTEHPERAEPCQEPPLSATLLLRTHETTDSDFLTEHFGKDHPVLSDIGSSIYYVLNEESDLTMEWRVNTMGLLNEIANAALPHNAGVLQNPLNIFRKLLAMVAERAIVLNDKQLNKLMLRLSLYSINDPSSEDFCPSKVNRYLEAPDGPSEVEQLRAEIAELKQQLNKRDEPKET